MTSTAFIINGGAGRVLCSIPALEQYHEDNPEDDFIILVDSFAELYSGHPVLDRRNYPMHHKNVFVDKIKSRSVYSPEPYHIHEYYNQQCNIAQAFDISINNAGVRELPRPSVYLSKAEQYGAAELIKNIKSTLGNKKVVVFQPFGRGSNLTPNMVTSDSYGKSFTMEDAVKLADLLTEDYIVLLMAEVVLDLKQYGCKRDVPFFENFSLRQWMALINAADYFVGCDSVGQHMAYAFNKPATVVLGSTFKENVTYPEDPKFTILDFDENNKEYSPIRICHDDTADRVNERLMQLTEDNLKQIAQSVKKGI